MNLHNVVSGYVNAVNPNIALLYKASDGYTTAANGKQVPKYFPPVVVRGQMQSLTFSEIKHMDSLNIQGVRRAIYFNGEVDSVIRITAKGGDLITTPDNKVWLVVLSVEQWDSWCKVAVTLQNETL